MKIVAQKKVEGCIEGTNVYDVFFEESINLNFIDFLSNYGKLIQNDDIENSFFRIIVKGKYTIKGSIGNKTLRILLPDSDCKILLDEIIGLIENY